MNSVTAPSLARASLTNFAISEVRSVKPGPEVCTVSNDDTMVVALTVDGAVREIDLDEVMDISPSSLRKQGPITTNVGRYGRCRSRPPESRGRGLSGLSR